MQWRRRKEAKKEIEDGRDEIEEKMRDMETAHAADLAADKVVRELFERYSDTVERKLALLEARLEVTTGKQQKKDER